MSQKEESTSTYSVFKSDLRRAGLIAAQLVIQNKRARQPEVFRYLLDQEEQREAGVEP